MAAARRGCDPPTGGEEAGYAGTENREHSWERRSGRPCRSAVMHTTSQEARTLPLGHRTEQLSDERFHGAGRP